jgi:DNA-binding NarL/FixJ family response regulator
MRRNLDHVPMAKGNDLDVEPDPSATVPERLTGGQLRILKLLDLGFSNQEIADRLDIPVGTTRRRLHQLFGKLGVTSRAKAVALARHQGLV